MAKDKKSKKVDRSDKFVDDDTLNSSSAKPRTSIESASTMDGSEKLGTSVKNTGRKQRNSAGSMGNNSFVSRLDTSLLASVEFSINENEEFEGVIDIEEELELNRQKEKVRNKMKKKKNKKDAIDPRLFPSYHERAENKSEKEFDDEDEFSTSDYGRPRSIGSSSMRSTRSSFRKVSAVQGRKVVQLSVIVMQPAYQDGKQRKGIDFQKALEKSQNEGRVSGIKPRYDLTTFSSPIRLLEIENKEAILVKGIVHIDSKAKTTLKVASVKQSKAPVTKGVPIRNLQQRTFGGDIRDFDVVKSERGKRARKDKLRQRLVWSMDDVNSLNLSKQIQGSIPFLSGYESYLLGQVVEVLSDSVVADPNASGKVKELVRKLGKNELNDVLGFAFKNSIVSNIIIESVNGRWDFSWHLFQQICKSRWYDTLGQLPIVGFTRFPSTENDSTPGDLLKKIWARDFEKIPAFDLSTGKNSFEATKRNEYGTYVGRSKTNEFRVENRLPVDESIVHSFATSPMSTMIDNGVIHVLRVMAKHWQTIIAQPFGNLTHHRLELLDPFETMRYHIPVVCVVLSSLRGRNLWDTRVLGPFVHKCQTLTTTSTANGCLELVREMQASIVTKLSAGVAVIEKPLAQWLKVIEESCFAIEAEAKEIYKEVTGVEIGLQFGYDLITQVSWKVPSDKELEKALLLELNGEYPGEIVSESNIRRALNSTTPRDKKTLMELVKGELTEHKQAKVLIQRMINLLKREIRRESLNVAIRELSVGEEVYERDLKIDDYYWLNEGIDKKAVYIFEEVKNDDKNVTYYFIRLDTGEDRTVQFGELQDLECRRYIPVAEAIVRAQRCYMNIELEHCRKFKYNAFTEFSFLRTALNRLAVVSQLFCEELDIARLNLLKEIKAMNPARVEAGDLKQGNMYYIYNKQYDVYAPFVCKKEFTPSDPEWKKIENLEMVKALPQSTIVIGGGITGLITTIHSVESVIATGGDIKLYQTSDDNAKEGEVFERAQIISLDPRWVSLLRYHLGTTFEDTFIPTSSETHAHLGSNLPKEGFLEIKLKDLESILHAEVTKLWSKEIIEVCMDTNVSYDAGSNLLVKLGEHLEVGDKLFRRVDPNGKSCKELHRWTVAETQNAETLEIGDLCIGKEYDIYVKKEKAVLPFKLVDVDLDTRTYTFESTKKKVENIVATPHDLPAVYPKGSKRLHRSVEIECATKGESGSFHIEKISQTLNSQKFMVDIGHNHVVDCVRKPDDSLHHFEVTSGEPCGFCCISRLEQRMESRGVRDTRMIGDSIKLVRQTYIAKDMVRLMKADNWQDHFESLIEDSDFSSLNDKDPIVTKLVEACEWHDQHASEFRRQILRIKLSETTDNFFLAMELPREYQRWKDETVGRLLYSVKGLSKHRRRLLEELKEILRHNIDILWFEACLAVLRNSGVYDPKAKNRIPAATLINSCTEEGLKNLSVGESFRVAAKPNRKFDILLKKRESKISRESTIYARTADGIVQKFDENTKVFREGILCRSIDGDVQSKVAVVTTPVSHYMSHHSISANKQNKGYIFASVGDEESTTNFMHHSALSGVCINAVQFNRFVRSAMEDIVATDRMELYAKETNWSNGEMVQRSTMSYYGEDGLLRPGFSNKQVLTYLWWQIVGGKQNIESHLSGDWMAKFAAAMIPRGMSHNHKFTRSLKDDANLVLFDLFVEGAKNDDLIPWSEGLKDSLTARKDEISKLREANTNKETFWEQFLDGLKTPLDEQSHKRVQDYFGEVAKEAEQFVTRVIEFAKESHLYDRRKGIELWNQPKPVDSIAGDYAADGRNLPSYLAQSVALCAASVALVLYASRQKSENLEIVFELCSILVAVINICLCASIAMNSWRYKARHGEARSIYLNQNLLSLKKAAFSAMDTKERGEEPDDQNPFLGDLEEKKKNFVNIVVFYGLEDPDEFIYDYKRLRERKDHAAAFKHFQKLLVTYYIPEVYQSNSYVQESLVEVYKVCDEIHALLSGDEKKTGVKERDHVTSLFHRATIFGDLLKQSIDSKLFNKGIYLAHRYFMSIVCISMVKNEIPIIPIETETYGIIKTARKVSDEHEGSILKRQIRDLEYLHRVMVEADKGAVVSISAFLVIVSSAIFVAGIIASMTLNPQNLVLEKVSHWLQLSTAIPAFLAFRYFAFYLWHLLWLWVKVGVRVSGKKGDRDLRRSGRKIQGFIFMQFLLTIIRISVVLAAVAAICWCVAQLEVRDIEESVVPIFIALLAFGTAILASIFHWLIEFFVAYKLPPKLGQVVCEIFHEEIEFMYDELSIPENKFDTTQAQERTTWEYVAREFLRKYRFDAIFGPDRAGSILQSLQCGLEDTSEEKVEGDDKLSLV